jgi:hypothetical protein
VRCLYFKELLTVKDLEVISELVAYLRAKGRLGRECKLEEIWGWMESEGLAVELKGRENLLINIRFGSEEYSRLEQSQEEEGEPSEGQEEDE